MGDLIIPAQGGMNAQVGQLLGYLSQARSLYSAAKHGPARRSAPFVSLQAEYRRKKVLERAKQKGTMQYLNKLWKETGRYTGTLRGRRQGTKTRRMFKQVPKKKYANKQERRDATFARRVKKYTSTPTSALIQGPMKAIRKRTPKPKRHLVGMRKLFNMQQRFRK